MAKSSLVMARVIGENPQVGSNIPTVQAVSLSTSTILPRVEIPAVLGNKPPKEGSFILVWLTDSFTAKMVVELMHPPDTLTGSITAAPDDIRIDKDDKLIEGPSLSRIQLNKSGNIILQGTGVNLKLDSGDRAIIGTGNYVDFTSTKAPPLANTRQFLYADKTKVRLGVESPLNPPLTSPSMRLASHEISVDVLGNIILKNQAAPIQGQIWISPAGGVSVSSVTTGVHLNTPIVQLGGTGVVGVPFLGLALLNEIFALLYSTHIHVVDGAVTGPPTPLPPGPIPLYKTVATKAL